VDRYGNPLSQDQGICPTLLSQRERLLRMVCHERVRVVCIRFLLYDVHQFESLQLLDMNSFLSCGRQQVVNLLEWWKVVEMA
jgi:hypothetical protein